MDLARALTSRKRQGGDMSHLMPTRSHTTKSGGGHSRNGSISRCKISSPVELVSSTNVLAFNAPNIYPSSDDSDHSLSSLSGSSRATTPETDSPLGVLEPNHLSSYFNAARRPSAASNPAARRSKDSGNSSNGQPSPTLPHHRTPSHATQRSQQISMLKKTESQSRHMPPPNSIHVAAPILPASTFSPPSPRAQTADMFSSAPDAGHPFGAELAQVNELAEGFGAREVIIMDEEEQYLMSHGLHKFGVEEYIDEVQGLFGGIYNNPFTPTTTVWI